MGLSGWIQIEAGSSVRAISRAALLYSSALLLTTGCTNNFFSGGSSATFGSSSSASTTTTYALDLVNVVQDATQPGSVLDLIGDGSGAIGTNCPLSSSSTTTTTGTVGSGQTGATVCNCLYSYTVPNQGTQSYEAPSIYHEQDQLRCQDTSIPSAVTSVTVSIHITSNNTYSNPVNYNFQATGSTADPTNIANYSLINRFQCRDQLKISYLYDGTSGQPYDPIQSEDVTLNYPLDFYTNSYASSINQLVANSVQGWTCPSLPNDPRAGTELRIFSVGADSAGSVLIYPPSGSATDRSTFYLANFQGGVFQVPVNAAIDPGPIITAQGGTVPPIGYGASPVTTSPGVENCPDSTAQIPAGYHWVKVWLFRGDLPQRHALYSPAIALTQGLVCNAGLYPSGAAPAGGGPVSPDCNGNRDGSTAPANGYSFSGPYAAVAGFSGTSAYIVNTTTGQGQTQVLADRVLGTGLSTGGAAGQSCVRMETVQNATNTCETIGGKTFCIGAEPNASFLPGSDDWLPVGATVGASANLVDPLGLYPNKALPATATPPFDGAPTLTAIDGASTSGTAAVSRYDFLFVVTPPTITLAQMENTASSASYPYTPYRFYAASQCLSNNPNQPSAVGDCSVNNIIHYGLKLHDIGTLGDPPANDPTDAPVYPVCALQPN